MVFLYELLHVTGSTNRTGFTIARSFIEEGLSAYVNGRSTTEVESATETLTNLGPGSARPVAPQKPQALLLDWLSCLGDHFDEGRNQICSFRQSTCMMRDYIARIDQFFPFFPVDRISNSLLNQKRYITCLDTNRIKKIVTAKQHK